MSPFPRCPLRIIYCNVEMRNYDSSFSCRNGYDDRNRSIGELVGRSVGRVNALTHARTQTRPPFLLSEKSAIGARENERARQMELGMPRQINGSGLTRWWRGTRLNL